jgi:hypothetical protein
MSNSSFNVSDFIPVDTKLVLISSDAVDIGLSSAFVVSVRADLRSEEGGAYAETKSAQLDGGADAALSFTGFPTDQNLMCRITVTGEAGSSNEVSVSINW